MQPLPGTLPDDPLALAKTWLDEAQRELRNAGSMTLATVDPRGRPTARMVICRGFDSSAGWLVFYTDRESDKGAALAAHPWAACVFHWPSLERQIRVEGPVTLAPDTDSDRYWATREREAQLAAVASAQSRSLRSRAEFLQAIAEATRAAGSGAIARPPRWGGYRVWADRVELWVGQPGRAHDRARWTRELTRTAEGFKGGAWSATRLQP
jgi:pyridoxamine 5'-phosphate oxidase